MKRRSAQRTLVELRRALADGDRDRALELVRELKRAVEHEGAARWVRVTDAERAAAAAAWEAAVQRYGPRATRRAVARGLWLDGVFRDERRARRVVAIVASSAATGGEPARARVESLT